MTDLKPADTYFERRREETVDVGGLRFIITSADTGANLALWVEENNAWVEIIRFQDYAEDPHFHAPIGGYYHFDRANQGGEPLAWWMSQLDDHIELWMKENGFAELMAGVDFDVVRENLPRVTEAMIACVPEAFERESGWGIRQVDWSEDQTRFQMRNTQRLDFGGMRFDTFFDRNLGASMCVYATPDGKSVEMFRLDDYNENPHYHLPVGVYYAFDRKERGEPLAWFVDQVRNHLAELLTKSRLDYLIPKLDFAAITAASDELYDKVSARVPKGASRVPGYGVKFEEETPTS